MDSFSQYDSKPYTLGGIGLGTLAWIFTANPLVGLGIAVLGFRLAARQDQLADQGIFDARYSPVPLPPAPIVPHAPVVVENTNSVSLHVAPVATAQSRGVSTSLNLATPTQDEPVDVPAIVAEEIVSGSSAGHLFLSCKTGSGKTTLIRALIRRMLEHESCQIIVADPKGSHWMGLEKTDCVCRVHNNGETRNLLAWVDTIKAELERRIRERSETGQPTTAARIILILDEWPTLYGMAKEEKIDEALMLGLNYLVRMGREDLIGVWVVGQSHLVTESGFSRTTQNNFDLIALGRGKKLQSVAAMAADTYVVRGAKRRQELAQEIEALGEPETPVAFLSSGGGELCRLPDLRYFVDWQIPEGA